MSKDRQIRSLERDVQMWEERFVFVTAVLFMICMAKIGAWLGQWLAIILS